jgi:hypothetical protein
MRKSLMLGVLAVQLLACGGGEDSGPPAMKGTVNAAQARSTVNNAVTLRSSVEAMNGANVASAAIAFNASTNGIVTPSSGQVPSALVAEIETLMQAQMSGSQMCTATGCKFDNYSVNGQTTINGTVDASTSGDAKKIKWDLTMKGSGLSGGAATLSYDYNGKGDITISATSLTGEVTTKMVASGSQGGQTFSSTSESLARFQSVVLANGMPTGGSIYAKMTATGMSGGQSGAQAWEGTHNFP